MTPHERVLSDRVSEELCLDLARKFGGCVEWTACETCMRLTHEYRTELEDDLRLNPSRQDIPGVWPKNADLPEDQVRKFLNEIRERVWRCSTCKQRSRAQFHYEQIAVLLYRRRPKPLSEVERMTYAERRKARLDCVTDEEERLLRDLVCVFNDSSCGVERQQKAARQLKELRKEINRRSEQLDDELLIAVQFSESFASRAQRMLGKFTWIDSRKFFERAIVRYLRARVENVTWATSLPLLHYLALEYMRDKRALWQFLDLAFERWKDLLKNPKSVRRRSILIHQSLGSQSFINQCKKSRTQPMAEVVQLVAQGALKPEESVRLNAALRTQQSRELRKHDSRRKRAIPVTIE
jgi:hypothetical protein